MRPHGRKMAMCTTANNSLKCGTADKIKCFIKYSKVALVRETKTEEEDGISEQGKICGDIRLNCETPRTATKEAFKR